MRNIKLALVIRLRTTMTLILASCIVCSCRSTNVKHVSPSNPTLLSYQSPALTTTLPNYQNPGELRARGDFWFATLH